MTTSIVLVNRSSIRLPPGEPLAGPLPGSEVAALNLLTTLSGHGFDCVYLGNLSTDSASPAVRLSRLDELTDVVDQADIVIWLRDYVLGESVFRRWSGKAHILWSQDTVNDVSSLLSGVTDLAGRMRHYLGRFDSVVFASDWHLTEWLRTLDLVPDNLVSIYNLASHASPAGREPRSGPLSLVNTSHPRKALVPLARVARVLDPQDATITCFGAPSLYQDDSCVIVDHGPSGMTEPLGTFNAFVADHPELIFQTPMPPRLLSAELARHDFLFHPDRSGEAGATTIIESIRSHLPPIVSAVGPLPELVGSAGLVVDGWPGSPDFTDRAVRLIQQLLDDDVRREYERRTALRSCDFSDETIVADWCRLFEPEVTGRAAP